MYYFNYLIKCIIRRITYLFIKPKFLFLFLTICILFLILSNSCHAVYDGNFDYSDPNNAILGQYNSVANDFIARLSNCSGENYDTAISRLKSNQYDVYIYYGSQDGSSVVSGQTYNTNVLYFALMKRGSVTISPSVSYHSYYGIDNIDVLEVDYNGQLYSIMNNYIYTDSYSSSIYIPSALINYVPTSLKDFLANDSQSQTDSIVGAIQAQTNSIDEQTNTIKEQTEVMTSTDYDTNTVNIDTSLSDNVSDTEVTGLFTTIFNNFSDLLDSSNWDNPSIIQIPIPHSDNNIVLTSDILSKIVGIGFLKTLINTAWYFIFGLYVFKFVNNIIHSIKSGDILGGLSLNNEIITSSML